MIQASNKEARLTRPGRAFVLTLVLLVLFGAVTWLLSPAIFSLIGAERMVKVRYLDGTEEIKKETVGYSKSTAVKDSSNVYALLVGGTDRYYLDWTVFIILIFLALFILILLVDLAVKGKVLWFIGYVLSWGYPSVGESLQLLREWYNKDKVGELERKYVEEDHGSQKDLDGKLPFGKWMVSRIVPSYENNVQAMAYIGAAILIVLIGLRVIKMISKQEPSWILFGLELEFSLLILLGFIVFFKPEERKQGDVIEELKKRLEKLEAKVNAYDSAIKRFESDMKEIMQQE